MRNRISTLVILALFSAAILSACGTGEAGPAVLPVGSLWNPPAGQGDLDWQAVEAAVASEPDMPLFSLDVRSPEEVSAQEDMNRAIRELAEDGKALAIMGPVGNEEAARAISLVNFFKVPMLVATADGSSIFPENNRWAFRLSPPSEDYARYLFGDVLNRMNYDPEVTATLSALELRMAVLYEDTTFGESAAVAIVESAKPKSGALSVQVYEKFSVRSSSVGQMSRAVDPDQVDRLALSVRNQNAQLVMLVSSDPEAAILVVEALKQVYAAGGIVMPVIVGQAGGFASTAFLESDAAQGVYVLQQAIDRSSCPAAVKSSADAQSYAAAYLLAKVVSAAKMPVEPLARLPLLYKEDPNLLANQRQQVYNQLMNLKGAAVPCIGPVAFDTSLKNQKAYEQINLTQAWNRAFETVLHEDFWMRLGDRVLYDMSRNSEGIDG